MTRLFSLQVEEHAYWKDLSLKQYITKTSREGIRGEILSSDNRILALSVPSVSVAVFPKRLSNPNELFAKLEELIQIPVEDLRLSLKSGRGRTYLILAQGLPYEVYEPLKKLNYAGYSVFREYKRHYPQGKLASQLVGRVSSDGRGLTGVEVAFEDLLKGEEDSVLVRRDALGKQRTKLGYDLKDTKGETLRLTIDSVMQGILEEEFAMARLDSEAKQVFGVILDPSTGEILAIGQDKRFNPDANKITESEELRDFALQDTFEPGSTLKPLVVALALEEGVVSPSKIIDCEKGRYRVSNHTIKDVHRMEEGSLKDIIVHSSNIGMAKIGLELGAKRLHDGLKLLGFGERVGIGLMGEQQGLIRAPDKLRKLEIATMSFGQGLSVNTLQLARSYAIIANGGLTIKPSILKGTSLSSRAERVLGKESSEFVKSALYDVVNSDDGTGKLARIEGVKVYGKTGTAQKANLEAGGYDPMRVQASFSGFVEFEIAGVNRRLVGLVIVDEPMTQVRWGGVLAAPVFKRVMSRVVTYLQHSKNASIRFVNGEHSANEV